MKAFQKKKRRKDDEYHLFYKLKTRHPLLTFNSNNNSYHWSFQALMANCTCYLWLWSWWPWTTNTIHVNIFLTVLISPFPWNFWGKKRKFYLFFFLTSRKNYIGTSRIGQKIIWNWRNQLNLIRKNCIESELKLINS